QVADRAFDGAQDAHVRTAAAQIRVHVAANVGLRGRGVRFEERLRTHPTPRNAVAALRRLLVDEGTLHRSGVVDRAESLDGLDAPSAEYRDRRDTRKHRFAIDHDGARTALSE